MESANRTDSTTTETNCNESNTNSSALTSRSLIKAGFARPDAARCAMMAIRKNCNKISFETLLRSALTVEDPDSALLSLQDLSEAYPEIINNISTSNSQISDSLTSLMQVLGASNALAMLMRTRPNLIKAAANDPNHLFAMTREERVKDLLEAIQAYTATVVSSESSDSNTIYLTSLGFAQAVSALRARYREHVAAIMAADLASADPVEVQPDISRKLSDAADAVLEAALSISRGQVTGSSACRFAIIAMGKLGAQEINYVSDIDLIYVVEPADLSNKQNQDAALRVGVSMAMVLQKVCQSVVMGLCGASALAD